MSQGKIQLFRDIAMYRYAVHIKYLSPIILIILKIYDNSLITCKKCKFVKHLD